MKIKLPHFILNCFKPKIDAQDSVGKTELLYASESGDYEIVNELLDKGANVNLIDDYGDTALTEACIMGHMRIVKLLVENGADVNFNEGLPLVNATRSENYHIVKFLLSNGADIKSGNNKYILISAINEVKNPMVVNYLIVKGADINIHFDGKTPLKLTLNLYTTSKDIIPSIKLLLSRNAYFEEKDIPTDIILKPMFQAANIVDKLIKDIALSSEDKTFLINLSDHELYQVMALRIKYSINNESINDENSDNFIVRFNRIIDDILLKNNENYVASFCNIVKLEANDFFEQEKKDITDFETSIDNIRFKRKLFRGGAENDEDNIFLSNAEHLESEIKDTDETELSGNIIKGSGVGIEE